MNEWVDETCYDCQFRIEGKCRKDPPQLVRKREYRVGEISGYEIPAEWDYPKVQEDTPACSHWRLVS